MSAASHLDVASIADMRARGVSQTVIARLHGCSRGAVAWQCLRLGVAPPPRARTIGKPMGTDMPHPVRRRNGQLVRPFTPEEDAEMVRLALAGHTPTEIGRTIGRRNTSVVARLATLARREEAGL